MNSVPQSIDDVPILSPASDEGDGRSFPLAPIEGAGINALVDRIKRTYAPSSIVLFGSRARGDAREDSDWDILVLLPAGASETLLDPILAWEVRRGLDIAADILCEFEDEFNASLDVPNTLAYEIKNHAIRIG